MLVSVVGLVQAFLPTPAYARISEDGEYGICLQAPAHRDFGGSVAFDGIAEAAFEAHNGHWHVDFLPVDQRPKVGDCMRATVTRTSDEYGDHHQIVKFELTDMDSAMRQTKYSFGYCDGDDQMCGKGSRNSGGSTGNTRKGDNE
jgi:hypothetical protein